MDYPLLVHIFIQFFISLSTTQNLNLMGSAEEAGVWVIAKQPFLIFVFKEQIKSLLHAIVRF